MNAPTKHRLAQRLSEAVRYHQQGHVTTAEKIYHEILDVDPAFADALHLLGVMAHQRGMNEQAVDLIEKAIEIDDRVPSYFSNLGIAWHALGHWADAVENYRSALQLNPNFPEALNNLGKALKDQGKFREAIPYLQQACRLNPRDPEAGFNLGLTHFFLAELPEAIGRFRTSIRLNPRSAKTHFYLSQALLLNGDFNEGWKEYEWREHGHRPGSPGSERYCGKPLWQGEPLDGKTILVQHEQGLGDVIQFVRYLPLLKKMGGRVVLDAPPSLAALFEGLPGMDILRAATVDSKSGPDIDVAVPLLSLPGIFGTTPDTIFAPVPYLWADRERARRWRSHMIDGPIKIGLTWAGNPNHVNDGHRSCRPDDFKPLADISGVTWYSLQKGPAAGGQDASLMAGMRLVDLGPLLNDFADTAAAVSNLDLIISVDTAIVHLAGAMARPAWVLLPFVPDWRWLMHRQDTPWYPSLRLFRQPEADNWGPVFRRVASELSHWVNAGG